VYLALRAKEARQDHRSTQNLSRQLSFLPLPLLQNTLRGNSAKTLIDQRIENVEFRLCCRSQRHPSLRSHPVVRRLGPWQGEGEITRLRKFHRKTRLLVVSAHEDECLPFHFECAFTPRKLFGRLRIR